MIAKFIQQGDVKLFQHDKFPDGKPILTGVLYKGQNNTHIVKGKFMLCEHKGNVYLNALDNVELGHEEHGHSPVKFRTVPKGVYVLDIVLEYNHAKEESARIID